MTSKVYIVNHIHNLMRCEACKYEWKPRVKEPKECPDCKARLSKQKKGDRNDIHRRED